MEKIMTSAVETFSLPALLGLAAGRGCLIGSEQVRALAALLLRNRPPDLRAGCFLGGALALGGRPQDDVVVLSDTFGVAPFLVIAGQQGASAMLTWPEGDRYRTQIITDPEYVDRAALVLAQLSDNEYTMSDLAEAEVQRAYVARLAAALIAELRLPEADYHALMPDEQRWLSLATAMARRSADGPLLAVPEVRQIFREIGVQRGMIGQLDADQHQLTPLLVDDGTPPPACTVQPHSVISSVIQRGRPGSAPSAAASGLGGIVGWAGSNALGAVPLLRDERVWGLLIVVSPRTISAPAQALLSGLASLIAFHLDVPPPPSVPTTRLTPTATGMLIEGSASPARTTLARPASPAPARPAPTRDGSHIARDLSALLARLGDAVLLVDGRGQVADYTPALARMLAIGNNAHGQPLVASGGACLAPLLTEALMEEQVEPREVELPSGQLVLAQVIAFSQGLWAFVLRADASAAPAHFAALPPAPAPSPVAESERNESFLANFSNIIRVPLRELRELITRVPAAGELNEQQSRLIGQVVRLNSELTMLVNDLLALGQIRLQAGDHRVPLRLDLLIEAAVGTQYAEFGRRGQHVHTDIQAGLPRVFGSEEGLGRAVSALIDNAIKYSPSGAQIRVLARREGGDLIVRIEDNGPGLRPDELAQVFDPFYRAESTESLGVSGRGLGLTIAKAVIEQHDGKIWAEGQPNQGCAFSFRLPLIEGGAG
jgi:signal transduction histidine kinase